MPNIIWEDLTDTSPSVRPNPVDTKPSLKWSDSMAGDVVRTEPPETTQYSGEYQGENRPDKSLSVETVKGIVPVLTEIGKRFGAAATNPIEGIRGSVESMLPSTAMIRKAKELQTERGEEPVLPPAMQAIEPPTEKQRMAREGGEMLGKMAQSGLYYGAVPELGAASLLSKLATPVTRNVAGTIPFAGEYDKPEQFGTDALIGLIADMATKGVGKVAGSVKDALKQPAKGAKMLPAEQAEVALDEALKEAQKIQEPVVDAPLDVSKPSMLPKIEQSIRDMGMSEKEWRGISDKISPRTIPMPEYFRQAVASIRTQDAMDPMELFNRRATEELQIANKARQRIGEKKDLFFAGNDGYRVPISEWWETLDGLTRKYVGGKLSMEYNDNLGYAVPKVVASEVSPVIDKQAAEMISKMANEITAESAGGQDVGIRFADNMKRAVRDYATFKDAGGGLYKNDAADRVARLLGDKISDDIIRALPTEKATELAQINLEYSKARSAVDAFAKVLGPEVIGGQGLSRHGGQIGKRALQSSAPGDIREAFRAIKELTGADLMQDALYANLAMRLSGDPQLVRKASQFGGMFSEDVLRDAMANQSLLSKAADVVRRAGKAGAGQRLVDFYTDMHGLPKVDIGSRDYVPPVVGKKFSDIVGELADESGSVGAKAGTVPFDDASGNALAEELGARFDGFWRNADDEPMAFAFTDPVTKSSFGARTVEEARQGMARLRGQAGAVGDDGWQAFREQQVRSPEFKQWFGDWENAPETASKVVDKQGKPKAVYHGTATPFVRFGGGTGLRTNNESGYVEWSKIGDQFTSSPQYASEHALGIGEMDASSSPAVMPVFLDIKNPIEITEHDWTRWLSELENGETTGNELRDAFIEDGYDGVVMNVTDNGIKSAHYITFSPTQIKSATGNIGTFDPNNPDIRGMVGTEAGSGVDLLTRMALGGAGGSLVGSQIGDTPEERRRNMLIGAGVGMAGSPVVTGGMRSASNIPIP